MTENLIEKAARAAERELTILEAVDAAPSVLRAMQAKRIVIAVLKAVREPNSAMLDAGMDYDERELNISLGRAPTVEECQEGEWQAMIDALLGEEA